MAQQNKVLFGAIRKLALAGERAGFTVEEMIELLNTGVSIETLLNLICLRFELSERKVATPQIRKGPQSSVPRKWL